MKRWMWVDQFAVRGGFGYTGSIDKNALPFVVMTLGQSVIYDGQTVPTSFSYPNPNVKWQTKQDMNVGLDLSLFDYRLELGAVSYTHLQQIQECSGVLSVLLQEKKKEGFEDKNAQASYDQAS